MKRQSKSEEGHGGRGVRKERGGEEDTHQTRRHEGRAGGIKRRGMKMEMRVFQAWRPGADAVEANPATSTKRLVLCRMPCGILTAMSARIVESNGGDDVVHEFGGVFCFQLRIKARGCI